MQNQKRHFWALAAIIVLPCLWFWPLFTGVLPDFMDTVTQIWPYRVAAARQIRSLTLPLWLPNIFCGMPLAANPQIAVWYPPQVFFYLWPAPSCYSLLCLLHYLIGGIGMYLVAWRLTRRRLAALFAAIAFQFGSMLVSHLALTPHLYTTVWIPWMILALLVGRRATSRIALLALAIAMQILAGAPQITYYSLILVPLYWILRTWMWHGWRRAARALAEIAAAVILACFIAGVQLIPTIDFLRETERGRISFERLRQQALYGGYMWRALIGFTGGDVEDTDTVNAIGWGALILAAVALARHRTRRDALPIWICGMIAYLMALAPLAEYWAYTLPMYSRFHAPRRALIIWSVLGPLAAGLGAAALGAYLRWRRAPRTVFAGALILLILPTLAFLPRLEREFVDSKRFEPTRRMGDSAWKLGNSRYITVDPTLNYSYASRRPGYAESFMPDLACAYDLYDAQGYDPLVFKCYAMARDYACRETGVIYPSHGVFFTNPASPLLRILGVQYLIGDVRQYDPGILFRGARFPRGALLEQLDLVTTDPEWPVYRFIEERPLAWCPREADYMPGEAAAVEAALRADPKRPVVVGWRSPGMGITGLAQTTSTAQWRDARTLEVRLEWQAGEKQFAFLCAAIPYTRGWKIEAPSSPVPLELQWVYGVICGTFVPPGTDLVRFKYAPTSFPLGVATTVIGLGVAALLLVRRNKREG